MLCRAGLAASAPESGIDAGAAGWIVATTAALLAAASWWLEHLPRAAAIARRIDDELRFDGALVTAFEAERRPHSGELARALSRRVAARLPLRTALRAALPPSLAVAAFPLAAVAVLALAHQSADDSRRTPGATVRALAFGAVGELAAELAARAEQLTPEQFEKALALAAEAQRAAAQPESAHAEEVLDEAAEWLAELARELPADPELRERRERAEAATDAARHDVEPSHVEPLEAGDDEEVADRGRLAADGSAAAGAGAETGELASGDASGTMFPPDSPADALGGPPPAAGDTPAPGAGLVGGRWWPASDDALVRRWVEARRAAAGAR